jgi:hypothetical protein
MARQAQVIIGTKGNERLAVDNSVHAGGAGQGWADPQPVFDAQAVELGGQLIGD